MAAEAKANGRNLLDELQEIYAEFGYYKDALDSFTLKGKDGSRKNNFYDVTVTNRRHSI